MMIPPDSNQLFPAAALLPLSEPGGYTTALPDRPGPLRPFSATLAVPVLPQAKKHDTNSTRWTENKATTTSKDGNVVPDSVPVVNTDS
jgi:hypothetical protein